MADVQLARNQRFEAQGLVPNLLLAETVVLHEPPVVA